MPYSVAMVTVARSGIPVFLEKRPDAGARFVQRVVALRAGVQDHTAAGHSSEDWASRGGRDAGHFALSRREIEKRPRPRMPVRAPLQVVATDPRSSPRRGPSRSPLSRWRRRIATGGRPSAIWLSAKNARIGAGRHTGLWRGEQPGAADAANVAPRATFGGRDRSAYQPVITAE